MEAVYRSCPLRTLLVECPVRRFCSRIVCPLAAVVTAGVLGLPGCATTPASPDPFRRAGGVEATVRRLPATDLSTILPIARQVFQTYYRLDPAVSTQDTMVSLPTEVMHDRQRERVSDVLAVSPRRHRQIASLQLIQEGQTVVMRCRVQTQRLDVAERAAFVRTRGHQGDDRPTETPIDRSGGTAPQSREEWVNVGRDRATEQQMLDAIVRALDPDEPELMP